LDQEVKGVVEYAVPPHWPRSEAVGLRNSYEHRVGVPEAVEALTEDAVVSVVLAKSCSDVHDETTYFYPPKKAH